MPSANKQTRIKNSSEIRCQFCGKPYKNILFAAFVCDSEDCINQAFDARGGPAGHQKNPKKWLEDNI